MKHLTYIEPLEDRIAPATIINPYTVTYQDQSGDTAVIKISKPLFTSVKAAQNILQWVDVNGNTLTENYTGNGTAEGLQNMNLLGRTDAQGMNISVTTLPQVGVGDLTVNVGEIDAMFLKNNQATLNIALGSVYVQGNLGEINAGSGFNTPSIKSLTVGSMTTDAESSVLGPILSMNVLGDFTAGLDVIGYQYGIINKLRIGGALEGDSSGDQGTGVIEFSGRIGSAVIGSIGNSNGQDPSFTGQLVGGTATPSYIGSLHVLGSITGGAGENSGEVFAETSIKKIVVDQNVVGGAGENSGQIAGPLGTVIISGTMTGGSGSDSGSIFSETVNVAQNAVFVPLGSVKIGGAVTGGTAGTAGTSTTAVQGTAGSIEATKAGTIYIGGSLTGGTAGDTDGSILVNSVKTLTINGNLAGGAGQNSGVVMGTGSTAPMQYGTIVVNGSVQGSSGAGSGAILLNQSGFATVGSVRITGSLVGSSGINSGELVANLNLGTVVIDGSVEGGSAGTAASGPTPAVQGFSGVIEGAIAKTITIGGTLTGGATTVTGTADTSGVIMVNNAGFINVGGGITGGNGPTSGVITTESFFSTDKYGSIVVNGPLTGGAGAVSGAILLNGIGGATVGNLKINGSVVGGSGSQSGEVQTSSNLGSLQISGSVLGGSTSDTGEISIGGTLGSGYITGDLNGAASTIHLSSAILNVGYITAGAIQALEIGGNVESGTNTGGGGIANSGAIRAAANIVSLTIDGSVTGNAANPVFIAGATGPTVKGKPTTDVAISGVTIGGSATYLDVLAGYAPPSASSLNTPLTDPQIGTQQDGAAQIGSVNIGGNLMESNIVAGAATGASDASGYFGNSDNKAFLPSTANLQLSSAIANITIGGEVTGNTSAGVSFGFVAQSLGTVTVNGVTLDTTNLTPGTPVAIANSNVDTNVFLLEVNPA
jgi:hypothetical protein